MWTFSALWQLVISTFSVANIIGGIAVAVAVFSGNIIVRFAIPDLRKWAVVVAVCAFGYSVVYTKGFSHGLSAKQIEWDAASAASVSKSKKARANADGSISDAAPDELRNDPDNRDND